MRLFVAIEFPDEVKDQLVALEANVSGATWVKRPAMHLTLSFLGDGIAPIRLTPIKTALGAIEAAPFEIALRGVGRFPSQPKRPARVLWVGIKDQPRLIALQAAVAGALAEVGFTPEDRPFSPHVTLARLKNGGRVDGFLDQHKAFRAEPFPVSEFHLFSSVLTPQGPNYRREASFALKA